MEQALREYFVEHGQELVAAYLFGSVARGTTGPHSDVDVAALFRATPPATLSGSQFAIAADLERLVRRPVDFVVLNRAPADLVHRVLRDGILLLDRDTPARISFEVRLRNEYFDLQGVRDRYRRVGGAAQ